ncbi:MAG TPA: type II toxin-antitoxin system RelE/ParE family toxin [Rhodospirillales bacterium]|nr:type II toxin-antitoxin system RelE/ParE family toxin [Rhodospirillales bacterium]
MLYYLVVYFFWRNKPGKSFVRVFTNKPFDRWAKKTTITDNQLVNAAVEVVRGEWDADLGGALYKKRIAETGKGKSGSYRTLIAMKVNGTVFFLHGFKKNDKGNITGKEKAELKKLAKVYVRLTDVQLNIAKIGKALREIKNG